MDFYVPIESDDIASDPFDDEDFEQPRSVSQYSDWPVELSPPPAQDPEEDDEAHEDDDEGHSEAHEDDSEAHSEQEIGYDEYDEVSDEDQFEFILEDEDWDSDGVPDNMSRHSHPSPPRQPEGQPPAQPRQVSETPSGDFSDDDFDGMSQHSHPHPSPSAARRGLSVLLEQEPILPRAAGLLRENRRHGSRHHPYDRLQDIPREQGRMANRRADRNGNGARDELVAVEVQPARFAMRGNRIPEVIDLTGEPDSPAEPRVAAPRARGQNPRRHASLNQRTPSLARSDGSLLGNNNHNATVIDLTLDDPPAPPPLPQQLPRRNVRRRNNNHQYRHWPVPDPLHPMAQAHHIEIEDNEGFQARFIGLVGNMEFMHRFAGGIFNPRQAPDVEVQFIGGGAVHMADPLADNLPNLDYRGNGGGGGDRAPKPAFVPPPPAREGFTRDLGGDDDETLVCPGCEKELHYDPDADSVPAAKKAKTARASRKDQEEHHFWALKECGHVYCRECFDHRKSVAKNSTMHFRKGGDNGKKVLCAVDSCPSDVSGKGNWIGLFL